MKDYLTNEALNILAFDPSMLYTGWVLFKPALNKVIDYGCIRKEVLLEGQEFSGVMEQREAFQMAFSHALLKTMRFLDPEYTDVIMEKPIGSQSARAAWALAMASQGVTTATICTLRKNPITYSQRDAKMHMFGTQVVPKSKTMKTMWGYWTSNGIEPAKSKFPNVLGTKKFVLCKEAVADALLILNYHLHQLSKQHG